MGLKSQKEKREEFLESLLENAVGIIAAQRGHSRTRVTIDLAKETASRPTLILQKDNEIRKYIKNKIQIMPTHKKSGGKTYCNLMKNSKVSRKQVRINSKNAANILGVSVQAVNAMYQKGLLKSYRKVGRKNHLFSYRQVTELLNSRNKK